MTAGDDDAAQDPYCAGIYGEGEKVTSPTQTNTQTDLLPVEVSTNACSYLRKL